MKIDVKSNKMMVGQGFTKIAHQAKEKMQV